MKVATSRQMREIDNFAINKMNIPGIVLMENAALALFKRVEDFLDNSFDKDIIIFAGKGNNGGDAFALARHLFNKDANICIYLTCNKDEIKGDARTNFSIIENMGIKIKEIFNNNQVIGLESDLVKSDLLIDGIFGTGLKGEIPDNIKSIIHIINNSEKPIISIDIPSGIDGDTGEKCGEAINANITITFSLPKVGLVTYPGSRYTGDLIVEDIGIPKEAIDSQDIRTFQIDYKMIRNMLTPRFSESSKGDYGRNLLITGSEGMTGAGCLCGEAVFRAGAGLLYMCVPDEYKNVYEIYLPEAITIPLETSASGSISGSALPGIFEVMKTIDALAIGPGMSWNDDTKRITEEIVKKSYLPVILDADAINVISENPNVLKDKKCKMIITPHPGEMSRLIKKPISEIQKNRLETALKFAIEFETIVILKGARTVIALPDGRLYINNNGNPGMATAGSGDVLTGILLGLLGQGIKPENAAILATYVHGYAGDIASEKLGECSLMARDIINEIPGVMKKII